MSARLITFSLFVIFGFGLCGRVNVQNSLEAELEDDSEAQEEVQSSVESDENVESNEDAVEANVGGPQCCCKKRAPEPDDICLDESGQRKIYTVSLPSPKGKIIAKFTSTVDVKGEGENCRKELPNREGCDWLPRATGQTASAYSCCLYADARIGGFRHQPCVFVPARGKCYPQNHQVNMFTGNGSKTIADKERATWAPASCDGASCGENVGRNTKHMAEIGQSLGNFNASGKQYVKFGDSLYKLSSEQTYTECIHHRCNPKRGQSCYGTNSNDVRYQQKCMQTCKDRHECKQQKTLHWCGYGSATGLKHYEKVGYAGECLAESQLETKAFVFTGCPSATHYRSGPKNAAGKKLDICECQGGCR